MVRGRLIARNGKPIGPDDYEESRAKRLVDREFNLSYALGEEASGRIEQGRWLRPDAAEVSLESGLAKTLGLSLGDRLSFDVAGQLMDVEVTSIRKVDWDTMQVNFFAIMSASVLRDMPKSWITSFYLPPEKVAFLPTLIREFPNITVFDVGAILNQLQSVLAEVSKAVQLLFLFTLAAVLSATRDERVREAAVLRALGATSRQLARAQRVELLAVGAFAEGLAATGGSVIAWALSSEIFDFTITIRFWPCAVGMAVGMAGVWAGVALALRGVLRTPPLLILRES
jgi:putative ABC transport system permease protein